MEKSNETVVSYKELKNLRSIVRTGHTCIAYEHYVLAIGNTQPSKGCVEILDTRTNSIESVDVAPQVNFRYGHSACLWDYNKIILFGGKLCTQVRITGAAQENEDDDDDNNDEPRPEENRFGGFGAQGGFGAGQGFGNPAGFGANRERLEKNSVLSDVAVLTIKEEQDSLKLAVEKWDTTNAPKKIGHSAHIYNNKMFIFGGSNTEVSASSNEVWCLDLETKAWVQVKTSGTQPEERSFHVSALINEKLYIIGGSPLISEQMRHGLGGGGFGRGGFGRGGFGRGGGRGGFGQSPDQQFRSSSYLYSLDPTSLLSINRDVTTNNLHYLNLESMTWERIIPKNFLPFSHYSLSAQEVNGKIYLIGDSVDLWIYDTVQNVLQKVSLEDSLPQFKTKYPSACVNNKIYFWGCELEVPAARLISISIPKQSTVKISSGKQSYSNNILTHMRRLFSEKMFSDITFEVEGQKVQAHRNILIKCRFFDNMFQSGMKESTASTIQITDISLNNFKAMLEFIYCNEVMLSEKLALDLLVLADKYSLPELKVDCEAFLSKQLNPENILQVAKTAELALAAELEKNVADYVIQNLDILEESVDIQKLPPSIFIRAIRQQKFRNNQ